MKIKLFIVGIFTAIVAYANQHPESIAGASSKGAYASAGTVAAFGLTGSEWTAIGVVGGLVIGLLNVWVNLRFKRKISRGDAG